MTALEALTSQLARRSTSSYSTTRAGDRAAPPISRAPPGLSATHAPRHRARAPAHPGRGESAMPFPAAPSEAIALFCERSRLEPSERSPSRRAPRRRSPSQSSSPLPEPQRSPPRNPRALSQRLDLLKGGRDADPRQQTLRATIEWRTSSSARRAAALRPSRRLRTAAAPSKRPKKSATPTSTRCSRSSTRASCSLHASERYWMLETIREYAERVFGGTGEEEVVGAICATSRARGGGGARAVGAAHRRLAATARRRGSRTSGRRSVGS